MQFTRVLLPLFAAVLAAVGANAEAEVEPIVTVETATYSATRVYDTIVSTSPWLESATTLVVWTETFTATTYPTEAVQERAHPREFNL